MGVVEILFKVPALVWAVTGALLGWATVIGPFFPQREPWYAGLTDLLPSTTLLAIADALRWDQASAWISTVAAWLTTQPWIFLVAGAAVVILVFLIADDPDRGGLMPAATFWVGLAFLAQTWGPFAGASWSGVPAALQSLNPIWVLLLAFFVLSLLSAIMQYRRDPFYDILEHTGGMYLVTMFTGLIAPVVYVQPLFSEKRAN